MILKLLRDISRVSRRMDRTDPNVIRIIQTTQQIEKLIIRYISENKE
jgi:hypothetical protein